MPKLEFFLVAESVAVDKSTNRLSLFNIIEELKAVILPKEVNIQRGSLPHIYLVSSWNLDPQDLGKKYQIKFRVHRPTQQPEELGTLELHAERRKQRIIQLLIGCPMTEGETVFEVLLDGVHQANHLVTIQSLDSPISRNGSPTGS